MDLLKSMIIVSEKAANIARICRQDEHLFKLLIQQKDTSEANPRFVHDFKTLADVLIQEMVKHEIGRKFPNLKEAIRGEESNTFSNRLGESIVVRVEETHEGTARLLQAVLNGDRLAADLLADVVHRNVAWEEVNVDFPAGDAGGDIDVAGLGLWIDPIDSTSEYISGSGRLSNNGIAVNGLGCVTVLIGAFDVRTKLPVLGVVNQPFVQLSQADGWSGKCFWGLKSNTSAFCFKSATGVTRNRLICVSGSEDREVVDKLKNKGYGVVEASGAGYKILAVISGLADAYLLTKDTTFKWDTCGPQAILRAQGGDICNYNEAIMKKVQSVQYPTDSCTCNTGGIIAFKSIDIFNDIINCLL